MTTRAPARSIRATATLPPLLAAGIGPGKAGDFGRAGQHNGAAPRRSN